MGSVKQSWFWDERRNIQGNNFYFCFAWIHSFSYESVGCNIVLAVQQFRAHKPQIWRLEPFYRDKQQNWYWKPLEWSWVYCNEDWCISGLSCFSKKSLEGTSLTGICTLHLQNTLLVSVFSSLQRCRYILLILTVLRKRLCLRRMSLPKDLFLSALKSKETLTLTFFLFVF